MEYLADSPTLQFSPKQVAFSLQVSESSVKRWCDRGIIPNIRTVGGHRRITLSGLREFLHSTNRELVDPSALGLNLPDLRGRTDWESEKVQENKVQENNAQPTPGRGGEPSQQAFREALAGGNEQRCIEILYDRIARGSTRAEAAEDLIAEGMRGIGDAWNCGDVQVYQERRSCNICSRLIYKLREGIPPLPSHAPLAIGSAPESDPYQLPTALVELALRENGWNAFNLGNNLPLESLMQAVGDYKPDMVWLSVTSVSDANRFVRDQNKLADSLPENVSLIVGGQALDDQLRPRLRYTAHCDSLRHLIELAAILNR